MSDNQFPPIGSAAFKPTKLLITKLEAARRQLATAIGLWFHNGDPVSIHALAYAAHEILHVISRRRGDAGLLYTNAAIKEEHRKEFNVFIKKHANWIKHAKDDWDSTLDFNPTAGLSFIMVSLWGVIKLGEELNDAESTLLAWACLHQPTWFKDHIVKNTLPDDLATQLRSLNRREFYEAIAILRGQARQPARPQN